MEMLTTATWDLVTMQKQVGSTYQHVKIDQEMEELKQTNIIAVVKFRTKLYVGTRDQQGQDDLLTYSFDNDQEMAKFNGWIKQRYNKYLEDMEG